MKLQSRVCVAGKKKMERVKAYYCSGGVVIGEGAYVDDFEKDAALIFC